MVLLGLSSFANSLVSRTLEASLGIPVRVGGVHLKLLMFRLLMDTNSPSGEAYPLVSETSVIPIEVGLQNVKLMNPGGFEEPVMIFMPELFIRINPEGFLRGKIHIQQIRLHVEEVTAERSMKGKINLNEWLQILKTPQKAAPPETVLQPSPAPGKPQERQKKAGAPLQIDEVLLNLGRVRYVDDAKLQLEPKVFALNIRNERLHNASDPVMISQQVLEFVLKRVGLWAMSAQIDKMASEGMEQARGAVENFFK